MKKHKTSQRVAALVSSMVEGREISWYSFGRIWFNEWGEWSWSLFREAIPPFSRWLHVRASLARSFKSWNSCLFLLFHNLISYVQYVSSRYTSLNELCVAFILRETVSSIQFFLVPPLPEFLNSDWNSLNWKCWSAFVERPFGPPLSCSSRQMQKERHLVSNIKTSSLVLRMQNVNACFATTIDSITSLPREYKYRVGYEKG